MDKSFRSYVVEERSYVAYLKREIHQQAIAQKKFTERQAGEIDIVVAEITSNLIKHAGGGEILYRIQNTGDDGALFEIISIDKGQGITDTARMIKDGVSTTRTLGGGLGAINRLSSIFQLYSMPGWGTVLYSAISTTANKSLPPKPLDVEIKAVCVDKPRETVCGDGYSVKHTASEIIVFFGDGLGHGERAQDAVNRAGDFILETTETEPVEILKQMHEKVRKTRGLVATVATCDMKRNEWTVCGVGNILTRVYTGVQYKTYLSYNGTLGLTIPRAMKTSAFPVESNQQIVMCSDGIQSRWDLNRYPGILKYDTTVLAACIYKDFSRRIDDSSILIAKVR